MEKQYKSFCQPDLEGDKHENRHDFRKNHGEDSHKESC